MRKKFNMHLLGDVIANTLRIFGQGMKVVPEIAMMAADAGLDVVLYGGGENKDHILESVGTGAAFLDFDQDDQSPRQEDRSLYPQHETSRRGTAR